MHVNAYRSAVALAVATTLFLLWGIGALGVIGADGGRSDLMFLGVIALGVGGAIATRGEPTGMTRAMLATAAATMAVGCIALAQGAHRSAGNSPLEVVGLCTMYASLFAASAWRFRVAAQARR